MFFKKKKSYEYKNTLEQTVEESVKSICDEKEDWVWVDGYKGMSLDMTGFNDYQYEIGGVYKIFDCDNIKIGKYGFHFCDSIESIFNRTSYDNTLECRIFKVRGLIKESQCNDHVYVAKEIQILEEISDDEYFSATNFEWINNKEDLKKYKKKTREEVVDSIKRFRINQLIEMGYSDTFSCILADKITYVIPSGFCTTSISRNCGQDIINKAKAFKDEGLSSDMCAYLLLD